MQFKAPIPGMSLTKEPGNAPWEQPSLYSTPEEALGFYFQKLENEDTLDDILFVLENGFPLETLIESMTSAGVMEGYHTVDVKVIISPVLHEHLRLLAETLDIDIVEEAGPSKEEKGKARDKERVKILLKKALSTDEPVSPEMQEQAEEALEGPADNPEEEALEQAPTQSFIPRRM